jgi:protein involved in sex pheromone biosynthesis
MQKKFKVSILAVSLFTVLLLSSCSKKEEQQVYQTTNQSEIVNKIITDSNFYQLIYTYVSESDKIYSDTNNVDIIQQSNKKLNVALSRFLSHNRSFVFSSQDERMMILKSVADSFMVKSQFMNHPNDQVVELIEKLNTTKISKSEIRTYSNASSSIIVQRVSREDVLGCAVAALAGVIGSYGDTINDVRKILRSGISMSLAIDLALDLIQNASPWWKVGSIVLSFAGCLYFN